MTRRYTSSDRKVMSDLNVAKAVDFGAVTTVLNGNGGLRAFDDWDNFCGVMKGFIRLVQIPRYSLELTERLSDLVLIDREINQGIG